MKFGNGCCPNVPKPNARRNAGRWIMTPLPLLMPATVTWHAI